MSNAHSAKISASAASGRPGGRRRRQAAAFAAAEIGSPALRGLRQAFRQRVRVPREGRGAPRRRQSGRGRGWAAGRPGRAIAGSSFAAGRGSAADGEAQIAQRRCVGVEAQDLGGGRGALKRQALTRSAPAAGGSRRRQRRAARGRRRRRTGDRPPLPFRSPAPRPGPPPAAERLAFPGFSPRSAWFARAWRSGAGTASPRRRRGGRARGSRSARITSA